MVPQISEQTPQSHSILLDISYHRIRREYDEEAEIVLHLRNIAGGTRSRNQIRILEYPYFYIACTQNQLDALLQQYDALARWYISSGEVERIRYDRGKTLNVLKIVGKQPWKVPAIRSIFELNDIEHFEADIPFTHRFMIDHQLKGLQQLHVDKHNAYHSSPGSFTPVICSLDIEVDYGETDTMSFGELIEEAGRRITAIGLSYNTASQGSLTSHSLLLEADTDEAEIEFLKQFCHYLWQEIDPDIIITYNGDAFDWPYIINRFDVLNIPTTLLSPTGQDRPLPPSYGNGWKIPGVMCYDLYHATTWLYTEDGRKSLDSVAEALLGINKVEMELDHGQMWHQSLNSATYSAKFREYVDRDAEITRKLFPAMHMHDWLEVIKICGAPPGEAINFTERQSGEFLVFQIMYANNILIPPAPTTEERKQRKRLRKSAKGGLVIDPSRDLSTAVLIADFASMYPSIIVAFNIGGESFKNTTYQPTDRFNAEPLTSMAQMQTQMLAKRSKVKEELRNFEGTTEAYAQLESYSKALKLVSNSTFGSYNYIGSRFFDYHIASTITQIGRDYLQELTKKASSFGKGYEAIYGDTDSVFIEMPLQDKVETIWKTSISDIDLQTTIPEVYELLNYLTEHLPEELKLEFHDIAYRIIFHRGAKKRYAYVSAITKEVHIYGFESIRHDWSPFAKQVQRKAFDLILKTGDLEESKSQVIAYMQEQLDRNFVDLKRILTIYGALKRHPDDYDIQTPAVGAYLHYMYTQDGDIHNEWKEIDYFPYLITRGDGPQKDRARHPDLVSPGEIDIIHYIEEALRTVNRFNLNITVDEVRGIKYLDLDTFFEGL